MRPGAAVALAVLLVLAGCSIGPGGEPESIGSATPAPIPTDTPTPTPAREVPGLTLDGVVDADALAGAHERGLAAESYTYDFEGSRRLDNRTVAAYSGTLRASRECGTYSYEAYHERPYPSRLVQQYGNGSVALARSFTVNLSTVDPDAELSEPAPTPVTTGDGPALPCETRPFDPSRVEMMRALYRSIDFMVRARFDGYVLTATNGTVDVPLAGDPSVERLEDATVRTARIQLTESGRVQSLFLSYAAETDEGAVEGVVSFRYGEIGDTRVVPPWPANATRTPTSEP